MLYISRRLTRSKFMVMDTDDGIEQPAEYEELYDCVINKGIEIKGVDYYRNNSNGTYSLIINPYMLESSSKLAKQAMLNGINMTVTNGCLTKFSTNDNVRSCTVNLADYCDSIADYAIDYCYKSQGRNDETVVLVLDPGIKITSKAFKNVSGYGTSIIRVDVSRCPDKMANSVYRAVFGNAILHDYDEDSISIIDTNITRRYFNIVLQILTYGLYFKNKASRIEEIVYYSDEVNSLIDKVLSKNFTQLNNCSFYIAESKYIRGGLKERIIHYLGFDYNHPDASSDSFLIKPDIRHSVLKSIKNYTTVNRVVCEQLDRYLDLINRNKKFTEIYMNVAKRYIKFLRSL